MDTERMIRELRHLHEKHKDDFVFTGQTNWAHLCASVANRLEEQAETIKKYQNLYGRIE